MPARRRKVVRVNFTGNCGGNGTRDFHDPKIGSFRFRNNKFRELSVIFQKPVDFVHHRPDGPDRHAETHVRAS